MPKTAEQLERIRQESRDRILGSALRQFARHGYAATSVRLIAEDAGVSQGLLYNYFAGKEALLQAIFDRSMADVRESFERARGGVTPEERVERLVRAAFDIVRAKLPFWRLTYQLRMQPAVLDGLDEHVRSWSSAIVLQLEELLRALDSSWPAVDARVLFAAIDGAAQHYAMDPKHYPLDEVAEGLIKRFVASATRGRRSAGREKRS